MIVRRLIICADPYWIGDVTALEAPTLLLIVAETEAIVCNRAVPAGGVPENVNGTETVN